ncbi:MAG: ribbon-helix-helix domain-containing protein [Promethearchaeota archaeon]
MRMITLFLPEKYLEMLDALVASNMYPNRSEALRMATWKFLQDNISLMNVALAVKSKDEVKKLSEAESHVLEEMDGLQVDAKVRELIGAAAPAP